MSFTKKIIGIIKEEGLLALLRRGSDRAAFSFKALVMAPQLAKKVRQSKFNTANEMINFAYSEMPKFLKPSQVKEEIHQVVALLEKNKPKNLVEIGTANGGTLFLLMQIARRDARIISVDWSGKVLGGGYPRWKTRLYYSYRKDAQILHLLLADSHAEETIGKVKNFLSGEEIDMLFIDGDHSYEGVKKDFEMYLPLVRSGGIIAFHDIAPHSTKSNCEVKRLWDEVKSNFRHEEYIADPEQTWAGIGILYK